MHIIYNKLQGILIFDFYNYGDGEDCGSDEDEGDGYVDYYDECDDDSCGDGTGYNYGSFYKGGNGYGCGYDDGGGFTTGNGETEDDILIFEEK